MKLRRVIYFLVILAVGLLIITRFGDFSKFIATLRHANLAILALILLARYLYYWSNAKYFVTTFKLFDGNVTLKRALIASIVYNFLNTIIPSGGVSGASYVAQEFRSDVRASVATAVQFAWYVFTVIGYFLVLFIGILSLILSNQIGRISFRIVLLMIFLIFIAVLLGAVVAMNFNLAKRIAWWLFTPVNWILKLFKKPIVTHSRLNGFLEEIYDSFKLLMQAGPRLFKPLWYCLLGVVAEIFSIYIVFLSLGHLINPGIVIAGYSLAMLSSFAALFTSGVGVYEAVMTGTFVALGIPFSTAFAVVIIYRVIAMWLFIPLGLYFYRHRSFDGNRNPISQ